MNMVKHILLATCYERPLITS